MTIETAQIAAKPKRKIPPEPPDFEYSAELEAQDPYFNRKMQETLYRRIQNFRAGKHQVPSGKKQKL